MSEKAVYPGELELINDKIEIFTYTSLKKTRYASKILEPCTFELKSNPSKEEFLEVIHNSTKYRSPLYKAVNQQNFSVMKIIHFDSPAKKIVQLFSADKQIKYEYNIYKLLSNSTQSSVSSSSSDDNNESSKTILSSITASQSIIKSQIQGLQSILPKYQSSIQKLENKVNELSEKLKKKEPWVESILVDVAKINSQIIEFESRLPKVNPLIPISSASFYPSLDNISVVPLIKDNIIKASSFQIQNPPSNSNTTNIQPQKKQKKKKGPPQVAETVPSNSGTAKTNETGLGGYLSIMSKIAKEKKD